jgi:hypothetical protein
LIRSAKSVLYGLLAIGMVTAVCVGARFISVVFHNKPSAERESMIVVKRLLQDGASCRIVVRCVGISNGVADSIGRLDVLIGESPVYVPPQCFADITHLNVSNGIQIADFAEDVFLLLTGGTDIDRWQAKITIREHRVVERVLQKNGTAPTVTGYSAPWIVHKGRISSEEMRNYLVDKRLQQKKKLGEKP